MFTAGSGRKARYVAGRLFLFVPLFATLLFVATRTQHDHVVHAQAVQLPDGPGKNLVLTKCTQCHGPDQFAAIRQSANDWDQTISKMQSKGLTLSDDDYDIVLKYLSTNLGPAEATQTVNVNTAESADLIKVLEITDNEAQALVKARQQKPFRDWHEVAAVDGVDPKKIESKKDSLSF
jgi:competence protein ComEA